MHPAFFYQTSFPLAHSNWRSFQSSSTRPCKITFSKSRRPAVALVQGWAAVRQSLPPVQKLTPESSTPDLPGIHFAEPPCLTTEDLLQLVRGETPDQWVNEILRTLLGWRQLENGEWNDDLVPAEWNEVYADGPPDFIGKVDEYTPATDRPIKKAVQRLTRSIPAEYKQISREILTPLGFAGWTVKELTPNRTRRATAVNWILYWYRVHYPEYQWT